ncbi:hypothetical protein E4U42_002048 [Claviceps africana]|uniref:Nucleoporin Nup159/Nup146 N-terminal domain-containing protein n=1 Tax=Claviceps africana TaxID=83212 RepID=A0A8K0J962_9HYPO|nr:hypothetical protein E4U42_002048 [Claviceps africana]
MFANTGAAAGGVSEGPGLETIQTENFGFLPLAGEAKVRLTSSWTSAPTGTASLLSVASRKGLVAAAGPDQIIIATTESVRKAFASPKEGDSEVRSFEPQLRIPAPTRISHLAFTADERFLIMSAESGGGLAVYDVQSLAQGSSNSAFELPTNGESLRLLAPNPAAEKAELCAVVTTSGNLCMANLNERKVSTPLKTQVSCLSWSARGKQLCAGMGNGTICQLTPEGEVKADIPQPPSSGNYYVSSLTWLENNLFLAIYAIANASPPSSIYYIITRQPSSSSHTFQKLMDPVEPFGAEKAPHHSILRLRDLEDLQDVLIVSSTASTEIGILTRSKKPLANDKPAQSITNVFTTTEIMQDMRRPALPMTDSMEDSVAVGVSLDLSSREIVYKPIPSDDELEKSSGPLPGLWVLTHEGVLCSWWLVYNDAVKKGQTYSGLTVMSTTAAPTTFTSQTTPIKSTNPFAASSSTPFGASTTPTSTPAFGNSSQLGQKVSIWGGSAATSAAATGGALFGSSSFGTSTTGSGSGSGSGPAFGKTSTLGFSQPSPLGARSSPWAPSGGSKPAFGQSGFSTFAGGNSNQTPFSSAAFNNNPSGMTTDPASTPVAAGSKFSSFSTQGGFSSLGANTNSAGGFGSGSKFGQSSFGTPSTPASSSATGPPDKQEKSTSVFGTTPFKLESSFKPDPFQKNSSDEPSGTSGSTPFGSAFGSALGEAADKRGDATAAVEDDDMDTAESTEQTPQSKSQPFFATQQPEESTTPTTTPAPPRFSFATSSTPGTSPFGQVNKTASSPSSLFGTPKETPKAGGYGVFGFPKPSPLPAPESKIKREEEEVPLPPDTTTSTTPKASFTPADAPLPPDFIKTAKTAEVPRRPDFLKITKQKKHAMTEDAPLPPDVTEATSEDAPLPPDFTASKVSSPLKGATLLPPKSELPKVPSDEPSGSPSFPEFAEDDDESDLGGEEESEGSGIDVAKDLSPGATGLNVTPTLSPESSFGGPAGTTPATGRLEDRVRPLFGEITRNAPLFSKPNRASPRSPSPLRGAVPQRMMRADATRSVSAPGMASQIVGLPQSQMQPGSSIIVGREMQPSPESNVMLQQRRMRERQEAEETRPLVDEEDDEVQKVLALDVEGTLYLDEFIAHSNVVPPAKESVPAQVEAVYRDINSMIDTLGLNARAVKAFTKGHSENAAQAGRSKHDLEDPDEWVLCEIDDLGNVLDKELHADLEDGRVQDLEDKAETCQELSRDMQRLRAKQEDLKRVMMAKMDPDQAEYARSLPLSAEQAAQQNELRREYANFTKLLTQAEEALTILKTRIATASSASGRSGANVPTVEAIMRTISKMTWMAEKRSGDIDVLETQLRKMKVGPDSREGSPMVTGTPQGRRSIMMSPDSTPSRNFRQSLVLSSSSMSLGGAARATPPRKKLSGFSKEEKGDLMDKRRRRHTVLSKLKESVGKRGVNVWSMEDIE